MGFGQLVIGAPGCGKSTYCNGMAQFLNSVGRETVVVNLDPGNDLLPYECAVDVMELIRLEDAMDEFDLGPNGGLVYCMEYIEQNLDWLQEQLAEKCAGKYILVDFPGQVELFTHHGSVRAIGEAIARWGTSLCVVHLVDAHHCSDASKFLSAALVALSAMTKLEMAHVNMLSKIDLVRALGRLDFNLDFYLRSAQLERLPRTKKMQEGLEAGSDDAGEDGEDVDKGSDGEAVGHQRYGEDSKRGDHRKQTDGATQVLAAQRRWRRMEEAVAGVIESFDLVHFIPLSMLDKDTVAHACRFVDKANGFLYSGAAGQVDGDSQGLGRALELDDIVDLVEARYMFDPEDPYDDKRSSSEDEVDDIDMRALHSVFARADP